MKKEKTIEISDVSELAVIHRQYIILMQATAMMKWATGSQMFAKGKYSFDNLAYFRLLESFSIFIIKHVSMKTFAIYRTSLSLSSAQKLRKAARVEQALLST